MTEQPLRDIHKTLHAYARENTRRLSLWLPDLDEAAEKLGVSRAYVLDLLKDLENRGAVAKLDGRRGVYVVEAKIPDAETQN